MDYRKFNINFRRQSIFPLIILLFFSCTKRTKTTQAPISWYSDDPVSIPYRTRQQKLEKGNLVWNGSFESGKNLIVDTTGVTYRIDGWQKTGDHVYWVNINADSIYASDEAIDSLRAVKIHRENANETDDPGEGIMSDYIKVIPGNYQLTFYIRLENIRPNRSRLGTRIYDAVNIRLLYYDKNKIEISSKKFDPFKEMFFDNSFKSYSFSNYYEIPNLSWCRVIGKSCNAPCFDGDIPDEARFVKIFLGLKGTGTMWVDQVDYRYTDMNFTTLERMTRLIDTTFLKHEMIIPQPKQVIKHESLTYFDPNDPGAGLPLIVIPRGASPATREAVQLVKTTLEELYEKISGKKNNELKVNVCNEIPVNATKTSKIIFSIGKNDLYLRFREILPVNEIEGYDQGYLIASASDLGNIVFLCGNNPAGDYYAATTAVQLFDKKKFIFHNAQIIDYPDFLDRFIGLEITGNIDLKDKITQLAGYKINGGNIFVNFCDDHVNQTLKRVADLEKYHYNIFKYNLWMAGDSLASYVPGYSSHAEPLCNTASFKNRLITSSTADVNSFIMSYYPPVASCLNKLSLNELGTYTGLAEDIDKQIAGNNHLVVFPLWLDNYTMDLSEGKGEIYLDEFSKVLNSGIGYLWCGSSPYSYNTDNAEMQRVISILGKRPVWWDNSLFTYDRFIKNDYYIGKISLYNIFKPFNNINLKYIFNCIDTARINVDCIVTSELDLIKAATVADFTWNAAHYDPYISLWKVLCLRYGNESAKELILLNDDYVNMVRLNAELANPSHVNRSLRIGDEILQQLYGRMERLITLLGKVHPLIKELNSKISEEEIRFNNAKMLNEESENNTEIE